MRKDLQKRIIPSPKLNSKKENKNNKNKRNMLDFGLSMDSASRVFGVSFSDLEPFTHLYGPGLYALVQTYS